VLADGSTFAAYEVRRRIAVGGMGEIYLCRHRMLDRLDAVKVLRPHLASDVDFRRRFLREALSAARLRHPNVVTVYTADEADGLLYLAMEYVPGEDLATVLAREGSLAPARVLRLLGSVADALDAAHRANLVHRDIKPSNLLVTGVGTPAESVVLVDFGITRMLDANTEITRTGEIVGTIAYCSPEQLSRDDVSGACDQYALACVAFECLTGQVPFPREGQLAIVTAHLTAPPPSLSQVRPDLPTAVDAVFARAMAKDPRARFSSCTQFVATLASAVGDAVAFPGPGTPTELVHIGYATERDRWSLRVGWRAGPAVLRLNAGPVAIRGSVAALAGTARWLLAQAVARHPDRELCLAAALAPADGENWLWLNWLAHARPSNPPLSGPHVATTPEAAADLLGRLRALVALRRSTAPGGPGVLAVLDSRLGPFPDDPALADAGRCGIRLIYLTESLPSRMSTVDLNAGGGFVPDAVGPAYVRELVDLLADE
jgi:hypothetical protein